MEDWKNTSVTSIAKTVYRSSVAQPELFHSEILSPYLVNHCHHAVMLNGQFSHHLSTLDQVPGTFEIQSLSQAIYQSPDKLTPYLGQIANYTDHAFVALNTAFFDDGVFVYIPENQIIDTPIHLVYVSSPIEKNPLYSPRNLIYVGRNSRITIIEHYIGLSHPSLDLNQDYLSNSVTEFIIKENASVHHIKLQQESLKSNHISTTQILQETNSTISTVSVILGGKLTRNDINVVLDGEGGECRLLGLVLAKAQQHMDNHTFITHTVPHCTSYELVKGIHTDRSQGVFNGRIRVLQDAQKTNANQINRNLLLSKNAVVNSNPQLEINADDVKCTHGSSTGQIDKESLFYLRTRGLDLKTAQLLMINGFASEIIERIKIESLRTYVSQLLSDWLAAVIEG